MKKKKLYVCLSFYYHMFILHSDNKNHNLSHMRLVQLMAMYIQIAVKR